MALLILLLCCAVILAALLVRRRLAATGGNWIVVDGSNVLYWDRETPNLRSVIEVVRILKSEGYEPVVWFDANAGYLIAERYMGPVQLARYLDLPPRRVFVAPKGTPADPLLLKGAKVLRARVVTNDRFRDWEKEFPAIREEGFLVRGYIRGQEVGLELETDEGATP